MLIYLKILINKKSILYYYNLNKMNIPGNEWNVSKRAL